MWKITVNVLVLLLGVLCLGGTRLSVGGGRKAAYRAHYEGTLLYSEGKYRRALGQLQRAYTLLPDNASFALALGLVQGRQGNIQEATNTLQKARQLIPPHAPDAAQQYSLVAFFTGMAYLYCNLPDRAIGALEESIRFQKENPQPKLLSIFWNALGQATLLNQGRNAHRRKDMPSHLHVHRRDMERSVDCFREALRFDPQNTTAYSNYQILCDSLGVSNVLPPPDSSALRAQTQEASFQSMHRAISRDLHLEEYQELVFLVDISGSMVMEKVPCMGADRFDVMKQLAQEVLPDIPTAVQMGIGTIGGDCGTVPDHWRKTGSITRAELADIFYFLIPDGTTPLLRMLVEAPSLFSQDPQTSKTLFLISDGANICRVSGMDVCAWADELAQQGIAVNVLTFLSTTYNNTNAFAEYLCLTDNTGGSIIYLDNYRCRLEPFAFDLVNTCQVRIPAFRRSDCLGPSVKDLWMIIQT